MSTRLQNSDVLALIPAWNEGRAIRQVIEGLPAGMPVLVVDDGSSDVTASISREAGASVLTHETNLGKGVALMNGFRWALDEGYPSVLTLDADGQHDPAEAAHFIQAYNQSQADLIIGRRSVRAMPFPRNLANQFSSWLISRALGVRIYDNQSGYRLHARELIQVLEIRRTGFEFEVDVILQAVNEGFKLNWVDIRTIYTADIKSHFHPIRDSIKFFSVAWRAFRSRQKR